MAEIIAAAMTRVESFGAARPATSVAILRPFLRPFLTPRSSSASESSPLCVRRLTLGTLGTPTLVIPIELGTPAELGAPSSSSPPQSRPARSATAASRLAALAGSS